MALVEHDKESLPVMVRDSTTVDGERANQLIYQLVRVEEDGTVVPASEDEVIEMEPYSEEGAMVQVSDAEGTQFAGTDEEVAACEQEGNMILNKVNAVGPHNLNSIEAERKRILAQLAFLDALLQKLKNEEQERASLEATEHLASHSKTTRSRILSRHEALTSRERWGSKSETNNMSSDVSVGFFHRQAAVVQLNIDNSSLKSRELESPSSTSKHNRASTSNENLIKEDSAQMQSTEDKEISRDSDANVSKGNSGLEKLSIRELHEAFQTTFGRQTSVKDKQWLIRRISLGLGGSHEVMSAEDGPDESPLVSLTKGICDNLKPGQLVESRPLDEVLPDLESLDHNKLVDKVHTETETSGSYLAPTSLYCGHQSPSVLDQLTTGIKIQDCREEGKRKRKPTKRYIEELTGSDLREISGKASRMKDENENSNIGSRMHNKGHSTLGISKVKHITGCKRRHHCPNKNGSNFLASSSSERAALLVLKAISSRTPRLSENATLSESRAKTLPDDLLDDASDSSIPSPDNEAEATNSNLFKCNSPKNGADALPTEKARFPKKHHRPWTLREVMKLLEGVSHCGVGKWADIKRYSFSNSIFRSSTDLKDKWRNLVRASNIHFKLAGQGERHRKTSVSPVPGPILVQVHELTKQPSTANLVSGLSRSGRSVSRKHLS